MTGARDRVTAVKIQILLAVAGVEPDAFATLRDDGHLFVSGKLESILGSHR